MKILIIEDNKGIAEFVKRSLERESAIAEVAYDGERGAFMARTSAYDLIILDNSLPKLSGIEVLKEIRKEKNHIPVIMLTVKSEIENKTEAFNLGADDYITKPFLLAELLLRIQAVLKRPPNIKEETLKLEDLTLSPQNGCCKRGRTEIYLTKKEYCLLEYLLRRKNVIVSKSEILENVWDYNADPFSNSIETHITSLRKKLNIEKKINLIHTFSGRGYKLAPKKLL